MTEPQTPVFSQADIQEMLLMVQEPMPIECRKDIFKRIRWIAHIAKVVDVLMTLVDEVDMRMVETPYVLTILLTQLHSNIVVHPRQTMETYVADISAQLDRWGFSYSWDAVNDAHATLVVSRGDVFAIADLQRAPEKE